MASDGASQRRIICRELCSFTKTPTVSVFAFSMARLS